MVITNVKSNTIVYNMIKETVFFLFFHLREELGKNINADEAAAMGAVYQAAALSKAFKVKPFLVRDAAVFPIQVSAHHAAEDEVKSCCLQHRNELSALSRQTVLTMNRCRRELKS